MPRIRLPPTPLSSTDIVAKNRPYNEEMESVFALPPAALESTDTEMATKVGTKSEVTGQFSPPLSSEDKRTSSVLQRKRTLSGTSKSKLRPPSPTQGNDLSLPPPPSRARKIIQMKPKRASNNFHGEDSGPSVSSSSSASTQHEASPVAKTAAKRKQAPPSATSAAGRKIARKTAHSIIERRRRSKMNEEFGVLKNMIPACAGVEMHKLAILQAGIEYVRYLEGCVEQLKAQNEVNSIETSASVQVSQNEEDDGDKDEEVEEAEDMDVEVDGRQMRQYDKPVPATASEFEEFPSKIVTQLPPMYTQRSLPPLRKTSVTTDSTQSTYVSPALQPLHSSSSSLIPIAHQISYPHSRPPTSESQHRSTNSTSPPPLTLQTPLPSGVSPAFNALQFSPDLCRTSAWSPANSSNTYSKGSLTLIPLPQAAIPLPSSESSLTDSNAAIYTRMHSTRDADEVAEATATAALLMMTKDQRGSVSMTSSSSGKGMSVRDLLIS